MDNHQTCSTPITSPKQKMVIQLHHQNKLWFKHITDNKTASIYHMNRFFASSSTSLIAFLIFSAILISFSTFIVTAV